MKGAGKRNEGRSGQRRVEVMLQPVSKTEKDNVNMPAAVTHLYQGGSLKKNWAGIRLLHPFNTRFAFFVWIFFDSASWFATLIHWWLTISTGTTVRRTIEKSLECINEMYVTFNCSIKKIFGKTLFLHKWSQIWCANTVRIGGWTAVFDETISVLLI